jgi:hypothetical protein
MTRPLRPGDGDFTWVVSLTFAGVVWRWTSEADPADFTSWTGRFGGNVAVDDIVEQISLRGEVPNPSVSVTVQFPDDAPVAARIAEGHRLDGAPVELALVPMTSGDLEADRYVVFVGYVADPTYGGPDEPVAFEARRYEHGDRALYPPGTWKVSDLTWPLVDVSPVVPAGIPTPDLTRTYSPADDALDQPYPVPFGQQAADMPAVTALVVSETNDEPPRATTLLVAGGHTETTCTLWYEDEAGDWQSITGATVEHDFDGLGQPVSIVDLSSQTNTIREARPWLTSWPNGSTSTPGDGVLRGAGQIGTWLLRQSSVPAGLVAPGSASSLLDAYDMAGGLSDAVEPMAWLADRIVGPLPAALLTTDAGELQLAPIRWQGTGTDAVAALVAGDSTVERVGPVALNADGRARTVTVSYARHAGTKTSTATAYRVAVDRPDTVAVEVEADHPEIYDERSAHLVAEWLAWRETRPHPEIRLILATDSWAWLQAGDVVTYTEPDLLMDAVPCIVLEVDRTTAATMSVVLTPTAG